MGAGVEESEPVYLELVDALELYAAIVGGATRQASDQLRDQAGLEGALARPRSYAAYEDAPAACAVSARRDAADPVARPVAVALGP